MSVRCEANRRWHVEPQCENTARVMLNGRNYCYFHASLLVFNSLARITQNIGRCECVVTGLHFPASGPEKELREIEGWRCKKKAVTTLNGINMCCSHAKMIMLQHAIHDGLARTLPYKGPYRPLCSL